MDRINEIFQNFGAMVTRVWGRFSITQRVIGIVAAVLLLVTLSTFFIFQDKQNNQYLYVNLPQDDITAITNFLSKNNYTSFHVDDKGISVPDQDIDKIRIMLSQEGLPQKGLVGWEQFDQKDFTRTEFEQEIQKMRAIQGELARTISSIEGINSARVHIVVPKTSLFVREEKQPTASIYLKSKRGFEPDKKQIKGIQHMVSHAVEGLKPNQISIINSDGRLLTEVETTDEAMKQSKESLTYKRQIEKNLEDRIRAIVGRIVGPDRIEAKVDAEIDFTVEKQTISDIDPDDVAVVSRNTSGFSMEGQGLNPTGIPGSKSNVPGEQENVEVNTSKAGSTKDTELINYEFSKVVSQKNLAVGKILRLTVSAIVDGSQVYPLDGSIPEFEPRPESEMKKIEELIKDSVGFVEQRDSLTVHNMMFQLDPYQALEIKKQKKEDREYLSTLVISSVIALAIIFFFAFIVRPYFRWLSYDPERKEEQSIVEEYKPDLELGSMQNVQIQEDVPFEKLSPKEQVLYLAKNEPKRTTEAIRIMISPTYQG